MILRPLRPHPLLAPHIEKMWLFESDIGIPSGDMRTIVPNGLMKMIIPYRGSLISSRRGARMRVCPEGSISLVGLMEQPVTIDSQGPTGAIGIEFKPSSAIEEHEPGELGAFPLCTIRIAGIQVGSPRQEGTMNHLINWVEIPVINMDRACRFYANVLGVELHRMELGGSTYALFPTEDRFNAGALVKGKDRAPAKDGTLVYLDGSPDLAEILRKVPKAGGRVLMEKTWLSKEAGYAGVFVDSEGNRIGLQHM